MTNGKLLDGALVSRKGEAKPQSEPTIRQRRRIEGRRVGTTLPTEIYVQFKAYVARHGITGEQAIVSAIEQLLRQG